MAMADPQLVKARLRVRPLTQKYNSYPWPTNEADNPDPDYFGPDDRRLILAELFNLQLDDIKQKPIEIEPPFHCDYVRHFLQSHHKKLQTPTLTATRSSIYSQLLLFWSGHQH